MLNHEWILSLSMGYLLLFWFFFLITGRDVLGLRGGGGCVWRSEDNFMEPMLSSHFDAANNLSLAELISQPVFCFFRHQGCRTKDSCVLGLPHP